MELCNQLAHLQLGIIGGGVGVTIAMLDTGYFSHPALNKNIYGNNRVLAQYDAISDQVVAATANTDENGHGAHVASLAVGGYRTNALNPTSIAPAANLVTVKAFGADGSGSYADVIRGIDWIVANKAAHNIRVLNLSFSAEPQSHYWDDPLNQAVKRAWQAGIVVVAAAGNTGPDPMTIGVPGNVPYIITVGAMNDNGTVRNDDDGVAEFSSAGPTVEGFVKPELLAPGRNLKGLVSKNTQLAQANPQHFYDVHQAYYSMTGTSMAVGVVSGVVALVLSQNPNLTPDQIKYRLMDTAKTAVDANGELAYSLFQRGRG